MTSEAGQLLLQGAWSISHICMSFVNVASQSPTQRLFILMPEHSPAGRYTQEPRSMCLNALYEIITQLMFINYCDLHTAGGTNGCYPFQVGVSKNAAVT